MSIFDVGIIGAGMAGSFACLKLAKEKNVKTILFDLGRPPMERRRQLEGWLGCLPNSDGKLYTNDLNKITDLIGSRKANSSYNWFTKIINSTENKFAITKDKLPAAALVKKIKKMDYNIHANNYIQMYPKEIHALSKYMVECIECNDNITFNFDNEVRSIYKNKGIFTINTEYHEFKCKKILIAVGRSGWRWAADLYKNFGIIENNDISNFGIRVEMNSSYLKDFNKSNCTISNSQLEVGPLSWNGTVIPEDHVDMAISSFRSNENRWKSDKVSFSFIGNRSFPNGGIEQTDRLGKLTFILTNDRIIKEKVSHLLTGKSKISIIPEYDWLKQSLEEFAPIMPDLLTKAHFHVPTINPMAPKIILGNNLESEVNGMFVAGESAGVSGLLAAACMGITAATEIIK